MTREDEIYKVFQDLGIDSAEKRKVLSSELGSVGPGIQEAKPLGHKIELSDRTESKPSYAKLERRSQGNRI